MLRQSHSLFCAACPTIVMSSYLRRVRVMNMLVELSPQDWILFGVCLRSAPMTTLRLEFPWVLPVMVGIPVAWAGLRVSDVLSIELAPLSPLVNKFS